MSWNYKIAIWNANNLIDSQKIQIFLNLYNPIDILLILETHFTEEIYFKYQNTLSMIRNILAEEYINNDIIKK